MNAGKYVGVRKRLKGKRALLRVDPKGGWLAQFDGMSEPEAFKESDFKVERSSER